MTSTLKPLVTLMYSVLSHCNKLDLICKNHIIISATALEKGNLCTSE